MFSVLSFIMSPDNPVVSVYKRRFFLYQQSYLTEMYFTYETRYMNVGKNCVTHFTFFMRLLYTANYQKLCVVLLCGVWKTKRKLFFSNLTQGKNNFIF